MPKSNYLDNALLNLALGATAWAAPATVYVALFTAGPDATGAGTEVTGGGYARVAVANNTTQWPTTTTETKSNGTEIDFPQASADWGTVVSVALFDAATGGNMLYFGTLTLAKPVMNLDTARFLAGDITLTES